MTPITNRMFVPINNQLVNAQHIVFCQPAGRTGTGYVKLITGESIEFKNKEESEIVNAHLEKLRTHKS